MAVRENGEITFLDTRVYTRSDDPLARVNMLVTEQARTERRPLEFFRTVASVFAYSKTSVYAHACAVSVRY